MNPSLFPSFFQGGFECSTHRRADGTRLDLIETTRHDVLAAQDYRRLQAAGLDTARDGIRWHLIEKTPGHYDWSSALTQIRAARETEQTIIWDVLHYGWPDFLDIWSPQWVEHFARFARAFAELLRDESDGPYFLCLVNEPSFFSFAGAGHGFFAPYARDRGFELKQQLVRAILAASDAVWDVVPSARLVQTDPMVHIEARPDRPEDYDVAGHETHAQFQTYDMICGRLCPELGGKEHYLDILGVNFYVHNQWFLPGGPGTMIPPSHPKHRPLRELLEWTWNRYKRPIFIAETGIEEGARPQWLATVAAEVRGALWAGVPVEGICLYPICNHPGWDDDRHCHNGLFDYPDTQGERASYEPLLQELERQIEITDRFFAATPYEREMIVAHDSAVKGNELDDAARKMEKVSLVI